MQDKRPRRDVQQGTLALMVLKTLDVLGPLHGYGIARRIEQISGDLLAVNQGTLYPLLLKLEQEGAIASEYGASDNNRRARFYRLTRSRPPPARGRDPRLAADHRAGGPVPDRQTRGPPVRAIRRFLIRLLSSVSGRRDEQRLREELEEHLALQTAENVRAGLQPAEARRQAMLKLGAMEAIKEHYREEQGLPFFDVLQQDLRYAVRQVRRAPFVTAMATLSLAIGIGANAAIFTLVDRVLLQSLPVSDPHELVFVTDQRSRRERSPRFSYPFYATLRDTTALNGVAARFVLPVNVSTDEQAVRPRGELVSGNYFSVLGAGMQLGRPLTAADDLTPGAHPVAVISDGFWRRSFAADPSVLGRTVRINNYPFTLVGVAAHNFNGTEVGLPTDIWLPLAMQRELGRDLFTESRTNWLEMIGRVKPGASLERAGAELTAYLDAQATSSGRPDARQLILLPAGKGSSPVRRETGPALRVLLALAGLALLLCCLNVASLLVVRSEARQREMAVRLALGARRATLIRQSLTETLVLAALGGTAGLLVAPWAASLLVASQPERLAIDASLDLRVFLFGLAVSVVTGLILGQPVAGCATTSPVSTETASPNRKTRRSRLASMASRSGCAATSRLAAHGATSRPAVPPSAASTRVSVSDWRTRVARRAPSASLTAISRCLASERTTSRLATLRQHSSSARPASASSTRSAGPVSRRIGELPLPAASRISCRASGCPRLVTRVSR